MSVYKIVDGGKAFNYNRYLLLRLIEADDFQMPQFHKHKTDVRHLAGASILKSMVRHNSFSIFIALIFSSCWQQIWGDNVLGDNFSLLEGDRIEDRLIVLCSGRSAGACYAGTPIVPIYSRHMDSNGHYAEYVETAKSNKDFIVAKTLQVKDKRENYWIINIGFSIDNCDK